MNLQQLIEKEQLTVKDLQDFRAQKQREVLDISRREMETFVQHYKLMEQYGFEFDLHIERSDNYFTNNQYREYCVNVSRGGLYKFCVYPLNVEPDNFYRQRGDNFYLNPGDLYLKGLVGLQQNHWRYDEFDKVIAKYAVQLSR